MGIRTGRAYLDSLRDDRQIWIDGERVRDVTTDPRFAAAVSSFSGRQQLYECYYSGDPVRLARTLYQLYDRDPSMQKIWSMLDRLEKHVTN